MELVFVIIIGKAMHVKRIPQAHPIVILDEMDVLDLQITSVLHV